MSSELAASVAVCIVALSSNYKFVSDLQVSGQRADKCKRVFVYIYLGNVLFLQDRIFGECAAIKVRARGECGSECAGQLQMNSIANEFNCK